MIELDAVAARERPLVLSSVTARWGAGIHSVLGGPADGGALLLALVAGVARPRAGSVRVLDGPPTRADVRRRVARVPLAVSLPDALRVDETLALAAALREEPARPAAERLAALGVETLASRAVRSLSRAEARAVALAEAVTSARVQVLLIEEPFMGTDPRACARLAACLRDRAAGGLCVVVETASPRDAGELATDHLVLRAGAVAGRASTIEDLAGAPLGGARIRIVARSIDDGRALGRVLAGDGDVQSVEHQGVVVVARGASPAQLARAAERAIVSAGRDVTEIRIDPPGLDDARRGDRNAGEAS